jgi:hypothetical protein
MRLDRLKRRAAAKVFLHLFSVMTNVSHQMAFNHMDWGEDIFTPKERAYLEKLKLRIHDDGEMCRKFGQRLSGR